MLDDFFIRTDYSPVHLLERMYNEASIAENYYLSPVNVWRCDVSDYVREGLQSILNVPFNDCGFLKTKPSQTYPMHVDAFRISAINMPMFDETAGFESVVFTGKRIDHILYTKNKFTLLNVMKPHMASNKNNNVERIVLSIGIKEYSYEHIRKLHENGKLFNVL